jgi:large subunit ribosomal protein L16
LVYAYGFIDLSIFTARKMKLLKKNKRKHKKLKQLHIPKFLKFKKYFQGSLRGSTNFMGKFSLQHGHVGLQALESGYLTIIHYDLLKRFLSPVTKNSSHLLKMTNLWINFFTDRAMTQKPLQSRMGRGKGLPTLWYSKIYAGQLLLEISTRISIFRSLNSLRILIKKLPILTQVIVKADQQQSTVLKKNGELFSNVINKKTLSQKKRLEFKKLANSTHQIIYIR